jgi:MFS family permease
LAKSTPPHLAGLIFSLKQTGVPLGGALAGIIVPPLVVSTGWRVAVALVAVVCIFLALLAQAVRNRLDIEREPGQRLGLFALFAPLKLIMGQPQFRDLAFASLCYATIQMCLMGFLVTYLVQDVAMPLITAGITLAVAQTGGAVGRVAWGFVADRWIAPRRMLGLLGLLMAVGAGLASTYTAAWPAAALYAACALFGAAAIGWNGVHLALVARLSPTGKVGLATGGMLFFSYFGAVTGPPLFGVIAATGLGYGGAYLLLIVPALAVGLRFSLRATD